MPQRIAAIPVSMLVLPQYCRNADAACNALEHFRNTYCRNIEAHCRNAPFVASLWQCCYCKGHCSNALWHCRNTPIFSRCRDARSHSTREERVVNDCEDKQAGNRRASGRGGQISAQDGTDFPFNAKLHSREGKRGDERVVRSCLGMMGVCDAICPTPWADSR